MKTFYTEIEMKHDVRKVWNLLVDFESYYKWNPWIIRATQISAKTIIVQVKMGKYILDASHEILVMTPYKLKWKDAGWNSLLVYAERSRELQQIGNNTFLKQTIIVKGVLASIVERFLGSDLQNGIEIESVAIKKYLEGLEED